MSSTGSWFLKALRDGVESVEGVQLGTDKKITVTFKTDQAPIADLLEVMGRLEDIGYIDKSIFISEVGKPTAEFVPN